MKKPPSPQAENVSTIDDLIPEHIRNILGDPEILPFDNVTAFENLRAALFKYFNPNDDLIECLLVDEIVQKQWDIGCLIAMNRGAVELSLPAAALKLLPKEFARELDAISVSEEDVASIVRRAGVGHVDEKKFMERIMTNASVSVRMLQVKAYSLSLDFLTDTENLKDKLERRRDQLVRTLEDRRRMKAAMSPELKVGGKT